jgi:hypothetical protein
VNQRERTEIVAKVDAYKEMHVALAGRLCIVPSTLNTNFKNRKTPKTLMQN